MIASVKKILQRYTLYFFLLPIFFVFHNYLQYYGLITLDTALQLMGELEFLFIAGLLFLTVFTRHIQRSAQIIAIIGAMALFFGVLKDFFQDTLRIHFFARYSVLLPLMLLLLLFSVIRIMKKNDFRKSIFFQNVLLLLFLLSEGFFLARSGTERFMLANRLVKNNTLNPETLPANANRPDIYFLVFDSYPGTEMLHEYLQYNNAPFDSSLQSRGFYVIKQPRSNYNRTAFSIASTLNFEYLQNIPGGAAPGPKYYNQASLSIKYAAAPAFFVHNGYQVYNLSIFDLEKQPALQKENFLVLPEKKMLLYNTLAERFRRDVLWNFPILQHGFINIAEQKKQYLADIQKENFKKRDFNNKAIDSLQKIPGQLSPLPKFTYAHFYLPHPPFFYDRNGKSINVDFEDIDKTMDDKIAFISYLEYTNTIILKLADIILLHSTRPPVIIIQSDHGYRDFRKTMVGSDQYFRNYSAFYFPDKNYESLYDSLSNVNTFPVILNKYFSTNIAMQKDSCIFMEY